MTSKQRAYLKSIAVNLNSISQIGKDSVTPENVAAIEEAFHTRELIKISVLKNCADDPRTIAETVAERTRSQVVQVIGRKFVLYRPDKEQPKIILPASDKRREK
ncbi:MAG: ribosome assembly RNA-binding protein YhbY [Clostridiales bacterium]|nr:ribosome assembly RNA-binding protein YhbY [Clostridiales bacterium]